MAQVAARLDDRAQHVMRKLDAAHIEPLFDAQQPPVDQQRQRSGGCAGCTEQRRNPLFRDVFAISGLSEKFVLDHPSHSGGLIGECALIELGQDGGMRTGQQIQ